MSELKGPTNSALAARLRGRKAAAPAWADLKQALPSGAAPGRLRSRLLIEGQDRALIDRQSALMRVSAPAILVAAARATIVRYLQSDETLHIALAGAAGADGFTAIPVASPGRQVVAELLADSEGRLQTGKGDAVGEPRIVLRIGASACTSADDTIRSGEQLSIAFRVAPAAAEICAAGAADLFSQRTLDDLVGQIGWMAQQLGIEDAKAPLDALALLPLAQGERLLEWGSCLADPAEAFPPVYAEFERIAHQHPERAALVFEGRQLNYGELNAQANRLAHRLIAVGVRPDDRVALYVERGLEMVVGLLAILKAGGGYVPLDPVLPVERIAFMLADSVPKVVLTQQRLTDRLPDQIACLVIDDAAAFADEPANDPDPAALGLDAEHLSYLIYTSGSTGQPKAILLPGRVLSNLIAWHNRVWPGHPGFSVAQFASINFDPSLQEILWVLTSGMTLKIPTDRCRHDLNAFVSWMGHNKINALFATTTAIEEICAIAKRDGICLSHIRVFFQAGEALRLSPTLLEFCGNRDCRLFNYYGPSETHVATAYEHPAAGGDGTVLPPIGRPIANTNIYILDGRGELVPVGVTGEIYIGGVGVARGYLNRPELTAERFLADRFSAMPGARMYRTGDLGRWLADGNIEFLGRNDFQVKLRGFRIELGEIEARLAACPGIGEAVVIAHEYAPGDKRLIAYVRANVGAGPAVSDLRDRLAATLPDYMVPSAFVVLDAFPLTVNGKLDRKALPVPEWQGTRESFLAPRTLTEEVLAGIWAELLGLERVGAADHFFYLGGHSLLATRLMSRLSDTVGVELTLRDLFEAPTLAGLATRIEAALHAGAARLMPPLVPAPREGSLPLSFAQQRLWFLDQLEPGSPLYNIPVALRMEGPLRRGVLALCLEEIVRRHEALRTVFAARDGAPVQVIQTASPFVLPLVDLSGLPGSSDLAERLDLKAQQALLLAAEEAGRPFDLARGPLLRGLLLQLAEGDYIAALTMHHIASDGWSMGILVREVVALYAAFAAGIPSPLPELPVQYADFAVWQQSWLRGELLEKEISFWRQRLVGLPPLLELPTDRPRPAAQSYRGATRPVRLPAGLIRQSVALARSEGATLYIVLLAGFQTLLARYSGQDDLAVGSPVAGRNRVEIEGLIGFFVNTLVLRCDLTGNPTFRELLEKVRETALAAYMHQDLPFEKVVEELAPERSLAHSPLFQVMFALQNVPVESLEIQNLHLQPVGGVEPTAKFDLTLVLREHGGELVGLVEYATDLFDATTIDRLVIHFEGLLAAAVVAPHLVFADLPLLSPAERHQVIAEWNETFVEPRSGRAGAVPTTCFDQLFADQVRRAPESVAVAMGELRLTYGELDRQVDRMAWALVALGVEHDEVVPLFAHRSPDFLAAVLALFRAGGAYLPLDPLHPMQRIVQIIAVSGARRVLASRAFGPALALALHGKAGAPQLLILEDFHAAEDNPGYASKPPQCSQPSNLAYVIYTSGSTGVPKGAMLEQRGMVNHLWAKVAGLDLRPSDRIAQTASQCFDISVWQFLAPLLVGGQVHIFPDEVAHDAWQLLHEVERQGITLLEIVPSLLRFLVAELNKQDEENRPALQQLRWLLSTGEALSPDLCRDWLLLYPAVPLLNAYGPTECSDDVSHYPIPRSVPEEARIPIGRPIPGLMLYILNVSLQPVPAGVVGGLFVGGVGVGRGYLGDGAQTAKFWWPDPISGEPGARLYRTGDLARYRPTGEIEYLGRIDHQVKVRGHRIELGEIEAVLADHPGVRAAAVAVGEDAFGQERLVAYAVPGLEEGLDRERVGRWRTVFDEVYSSGSRSEHDSGINLWVWISSYTGHPLPESEIFECFEDSVARILALRPSRLLEIGCGTGLLLQRIAPSCTACTGTDISAEALRFLEARLAEQSNVPPVHLLQRAADDFEGIPPDSFDVVVLNEVAQYFPSVEYLVRVVEGAVAAAAPGGAVFLGGLRSFPLLETFHTSVELFRSPAGRPLSQVREAAWRRLVQDKELAVDPALFEELAGRLPRVASLSIQLKGGRARNELTCFRYDAILRIQGGPEPLPLTSGPRLTASERDWTLETLRCALTEGSEALAIRGVPNARVLAETTALRRLRDGEGLGTAGELRGQIATITDGVEPADLWDLAAELGREAEVRWSADGSERLDILFHLPGARPPWPFRAGREDTPWSRYANRPDRGEASEELLPRLRAFASERLPEWMVPSAWILLGELPLTPNGKLDRKALPVPGPVRPAAVGAWKAPQGQIEEMLAVIWAEVLGLDRVGATDHFFDQGGHSLLATQVMSRLRSTFGIEMPLRDLFAAPRLTDLAVRIEEALRGGAKQRIPPLVPVPRKGALPVSFAQQRLWFIDQLEPGSPLYNIPAVLRVEGSLDCAVLARCLSEIINRHEVLRTIFAAPEGVAVQVIQPAEPFGLPVVDLAGLPESGRELLAFALARQEAERPFDLSRGPLLRGVLLRLAGNDHVVALTMHHIVSDGWSIGLLVHEVVALYPAFSARQPSPLPALPLQYADFAVWQRSWLQGEILEGEVSFWRRQLAGLPPLLELPIDRPRPAAQSYRGSTRPARLPAELTRHLEALARREGATLFMALLAAWAVLLGRYADQDDVLLGSPIAGRNRAEIEGLIGFFVNTLALRSDLSGNPSFGELLERVRQTALDAFAHQDLPFERIVEEVAIERNLAVSPLFQVMFALQNTPLGELALPGLRVTPFAIEHGMSKFDMTLALTDTGDGLRGVLEYATDLFDRPTIERLFGHYRTLLEGIVADPACLIGRLPLLSEAQRAQVVGEWSGIDQGYPLERCVHELFEERAELHADAPAVSFQGEAWTYSELDHRANRIAGALRRLAVGPEVPVGLFTERSLEMVAGLLGILKAGGAYVPLDPSYPAERLEWMLRDTGAPVVLVQERLQGYLPAGPWRAVELESLCHDSRVIAAQARSASASPDSLAYVLYTSGSTGKPKGVAVPHRAIGRLVRGRDDLCIGAGEVWLQLAPLAFDASTLEIWGALANGGRLEVFVPEKPTIEELGRTVESAGVTSLWLTAGLFHQVMESDLRPWRGLHKLLAGGDVLSPSHVRRALEELPGCRVINGYGPTENTTFTCCYALMSPSQVKGPVPIGRPIANTRVYLVDRHGRPVPPGAPGELLTGGDGLARGYHCRPDLTAEFFVPDPFADQPGERLYRTGDLARWRPSGEIEFLGRIDLQVKIRGFRVEPGEIEAALAHHAGVREALVLAVRDEPGDKCLVAYVVASGDRRPGAEELRASLLEHLPEHMVPSAFFILPELPLTPNGKVDRKALAALRPKRIAAAPGAEPRTPAEELLAAIFAEVLGLERVGIDEDFFNLGGHSLMATRLVSRLREVFNRELPLRFIFESPTVAKLAERIASLDEGQSAPPIQPVPRDRDLPLSFAQQRLWLIDQLEPGNPAYNVPLALRLTGTLSPGLLERIFAEIRRRHEVLRTTFEARDGGPVQIIAPASGAIPLPLIDLSMDPEREAKARVLALEEARRPFDLQWGPLLRLLLIRLDEHEHILLVNLHHIVSDGWSLGVLMREVGILHEAFSQGLSSPLSDLPVQYADFAVWQRSWFHGEVLNAQLAYWKRQLAGVPAVLELPLDRPRPVVQTFRGASSPVVLPATLSDALGHLCRRHGVTPFMALVAAWAILLGRHTGLDDVLLGSPIAGRTRREIEGLIGFFVNTLVLRSDLSENPSFDELLERVRRTALDAFTYQDLPFERLVEDLAPERSLAHAPLFQVMFVLQNVPAGNLAIPGLELSPIDVDPGRAKFDLSLNLFESPEGFAGALMYALDLFDPSTVERLIAGFYTVLAGMAAADPGESLDALEILPEAERWQLLAEWSAEETRISALSVYELFERQAERTPDAVAVICEEERWTYRDLLRRSREIAGFLRQQGVGPDERVAILDRRSVERVARILGVLASGAAFVAIDREQPPARRAEILADVAPVRIFPPLPPLPDERAGEARAGVVFLPELDTLGGPVSFSRRPESCLGPAYVVYTSGSTGRPKGIFAHHQGAATYLEWVIRNYGLSESDVALQLAPLTFDASLRDTLAPLAAGGRIVIVPDDLARDPAALLERMEAHGVTCLPSIVPSLLRLLIEEALASGRRVSSLRLILASGEKLHGADAAVVRNAFGDKVSLVNQYGASEATMSSTWYAATADDEVRPALPAGRPAASTRVFLLDRVLRLVPMCAVGEICFGGPGLTFGYLGQPDRTAEVFVPDPFGAPGERLYRTGDRGRFRPDGILELLGRIDFQVKIRGQRVELGEVEAVLRSHPAVRQVVVAARGEDEPRLAAWLVADGVEAVGLRAFLAERLPAPMIPSDWSFLDALPLTPHGKVDRERLPEPSRERTAVQAPRDRTELRLVRLWEEILDVQPVGISDNFFALGGHSLSAVRLVAGIRRLFRHDLPLAELFRRPTIESLADLLRRGDRDLPWSPLVLLTAGQTGEVPLFCIHGGEGHALTFADLTRTLSAAGEERPVFALEARGLTDGQPPLETIEEMAELYLAAIREVRQHGPYRMLGYSMGSKIAFEIARRLEREGEAVEQLVLIDVPALPRTGPFPDLAISEQIRALPEFDPEMADRFLAVWRANLSASHSWLPGLFGGKALLLVAEEGACVGAADPTLGWGAVTAGGIDIVTTPGDHFTLLRAPHVQTLVDRMRADRVARSEAHLRRNREEGSTLVAV